MAPLRESPVERYLLNQCRQHSFICMKFTSPGRGGVPDRIIITPGGTVFVEVKRPGEKPTRRQRETHARMRRRGALIWVVDDHASINQLVQDLLQISQNAALEPRRAG